MADSQLFSISTVLGFVLTLLRVGGVFVFVPVPGFKSAVDVARVALVGAVTFALFPLWPHPDATASAGLFMFWALSEAALGIGIGLAVAFALEAFQIGAQMLGLQAGFSFASTVNPDTQADSTVLIVIAQTVASLMFFASGMDREVIRIFAQSMVSYPPGTFVLSKEVTHILLLAGSTMFSTGLRLALPLVGGMMMVDISLALLGRINSQLQLQHVTYPVKIVMSLVLLAWLVKLFPALLRGGSVMAMNAAKTIVTRIH